MLGGREVNPETGSEAPSGPSIRKHADRLTVSGEPHRCLVVANCRTFSDLRLPWLGGVTMVVHVVV